MQSNTIRACRTISGFSFAKRSLGWIAGGRRRARTRRELLGLDAYLLRDIGLTHEQVLYGTWPVDEGPAPSRKRVLDPNGAAFRILVTVLIVAVSMMFLAFKEGMQGSRRVAEAAPTACTGVSAVLTANGFAPKDLQYCTVPGKGLPSH